MGNNSNNSSRSSSVSSSADRSGSSSNSSSRSSSISQSSQSCAYPSWPSGNTLCTSMSNLSVGAGSSYLDDDELEALDAPNSRHARPARIPEEANDCVAPAYHGAGDRSRAPPKGYECAVDDKKRKAAAAKKGDSKSKSKK